MNDPAPLLEVRSISKSFQRRRSRLRAGPSPVHAVKNVSFRVPRGATVAVVGESGAGKSTVARIALRLIEPDSGSISFDGVDVRGLEREPLRALRRRMQMIFQDPYSSLDPRIPIGDAVGEPMLVHGTRSRTERMERAVQLLDRVGMGTHFMARYPAELSGGQLQRVAIARALSVQPDLMVCDEPVAALDVSVRAQVINLMMELQHELGLSYLFITHDLALVEVISDHIVVMAHGEVVEEGVPDKLWRAPETDYTRALLDAIPVPQPGRRRRARELATDLRGGPAETPGE